MELDSGSRSVKVRDHVLFYSQGLLAGVARFVGGRTTPEARNAVVRKITLSELAADY